MFAILCFGASITYGRGDVADKGWTGRLEDDFSAKDYYNAVYNLGIPGNTSSDLLKRFDVESSARIKKVREGDRFVILIDIGTNDSRLIGEEKEEQTTLEQYKDNIKTLYEKAKTHTDEVFLFAATPVDESRTLPYEGNHYSNSRIQQFNSVMRDIAGGDFLDLYAAVDGPDWNDMLDDGLHPSGEGYEKMFLVIKKFLIEKKVLG
ncbi:TPA: hypothetical protein HA265_08340 [Candidatus Woesearchaeota archaeon]|nr:hypothetical protein [Candidatus Woesearchaeota archaeon]